MQNSPLRRRAITLIELLVVIAVIAVLIALLVPAVQKVRYVAARTQSTNNLKQCALASNTYHDVWKRLPFNGAASASNTDSSSGSWAYQVLPYIDQQALYDSQPDGTTMSVPVAAYMCAMRGRPGYYTGSTGAPPVTGTYAIADGPVYPVTTFTANPSFTLNAPLPYIYEWHCQ